MQKWLNRRVQLAIYDNALEAWNPELWAQESLVILEENMVVGNLVHRDFENIIAQYGEVVNTRRPGTFTAKRVGSEGVTIQNATATPVLVPLNQQLHVSFMIRDAERAKSFADLVQEYLKPALLAEAQMVDRILLGQAYQFLAYRAGGLGAITSSNSKATVLDARKVMNDNKALAPRNMIVTSSTETAILNTDLFISAEKVGDQGTALRTASIGTKLEWDFYMCQNTPYVSASVDATTGAINNSTGYAVGATTVTVDGFSGALVLGSWMVIAGDNRPLRVTGQTASSNTTSITFTPALTTAVVDNAVVTVCGKTGAVNLPAGYAAGYDEGIAFDGFTNKPQVGQGVTFGIANDIYCVIDIDLTNSEITLDRPLDADIADNAAINLLPTGSYNFGFHRNAITMVTRPLPAPMPGLALSSVVNFNGLSLRVVITYNGQLQGHLVTVDMLFGTQILDKHLGVVMLG